MDKSESSRNNRMGQRLLMCALLLLSIGVCLQSVAIAQTKSLQLASTAWPPFTDAPGKPRFALDLVHSALGRIGIVADTSIVDEGTLTPPLMGFDYHSSGALWRSDVRDNALIYSVPKLENRL